MSNVETMFCPSCGKNAAAAAIDDDTAPVGRGGRTSSVFVCCDHCQRVHHVAQIIGWKAEAVYKAVHTNEAQPAEIAW